MKHRCTKLVIAGMLVLLILGIATVARTERAAQAHSTTQVSEYQSILDAIDNKE